MLYCHPWLYSGRKMTRVLHGLAHSSVIRRLNSGGLASGETEHVPRKTCLVNHQFAASGNNNSSCNQVQALLVDSSFLGELKWYTHILFLYSKTGTDRWRRGLVNSPEKSIGWCVFFYTLRNLTCKMAPFFKFDLPAWNQGASFWVSRC